MKRPPTSLTILLFGALFFCGWMCDKAKEQEWQAKQDNKQLKIDTAAKNAIIKSFDPIVIKPCPVHCSWEKTK